MQPMNRCHQCDQVLECPTASGKRDNYPPASQSVACHKPGIYLNPCRGSQHLLPLLPQIGANVTTSPRVLLTQDLEQITQLFINFFGSCDRVSDLAAQQFSVALPQTMDHHPQRSLAHAQPLRQTQVRRTALA